MILLSVTKWSSKKYYTLLPHKELGQYYTPSATYELFGYN